MSNYQKLNKEQKEDLKEVFKDMKLSFTESERITGGTEGGETCFNRAAICFSGGCSPGCNTTACQGCTLCATIECVSGCSQLCVKSFYNT